MIWTPLDAAAAPLIIVGIAVPVLIFAAVVALGVFAVKMIRKISRNSARREADRLGTSTPPAEKSDSDDTP